MVSERDGTPQHLAALVQRELRKWVPVEFGVRQPQRTHVVRVADTYSVRGPVLVPSPQLCTKPAHDRTDSGPSLFA